MLTLGEKKSGRTRETPLKFLFVALRCLSLPSWKSFRVLEKRQEFPTE